ncbi:LacI family DNA-binding transcriptional regulator [Anaerocolumna cellulosilytica]|nr:LacI family DNA-binding transcriptional regulator [Anaerocolumna cellulosilytica]MBB5195058.1 DNA-binding LacI/PurR family transcriptional regulator [Anaerocolumna cellulosilytica]
MEKKVKMADIANELKVSIVTISKALSGQKGVSEEMRKKIVVLAEQMGYKQYAPDKNKADKSYNLGILVPGRYFGKYVSFYWQLYQEVATKAVQKQCFTMLEVISTEDEENSQIPLLVKEQKVDGIILMGQPEQSYLKNLIAESNIPLVCLDFFDQAAPCDAVISDGFYGTYMLTNHLFQEGHKEIAYVGTLMYSSSITDRYLGYYKAMMEHGRKVTEDCVFNDRDWETGDVEGYQMKFPDKMPTAFVCNSDLAAFVLIKALRLRGYRVPEDVSVVGFDNYLYPGICDVGITSYDVNVKEMADRSLELIIDRIGNKTVKYSVNVISGNPVYKDSVAKLNKPVPEGNGLHL